MKSLLLSAAFGLVLAAIALPAPAQDLVIGSRVPPAIDPHFANLTSNVAYSKHVFDPLVAMSADGKPEPGLALSWRLLDPHSWEFKLRPNVKFHDGSDFTAEDVAFSITRARELPNNPNPYTDSVASIVSWEIPDPLTIRFKTSTFDSVLPARLDQLSIVSRKAAANATPSDFVTGKATVGTGPYRFVEYLPGNRYVVERNDAYWGPKPYWKKVTFRMISNDAARVAALLGGDVDLIEYVPTTDVEALRRNDKVAIWETPSDCFIYWVPHMRDRLDFTRDKAGNPLPNNPFKDVRVRRAFSMAIDRTMMIKRVMTDLAVPADCWVPPGMFGYAKAKVDAYDPEGAKKLLAEAGYPNGFKLTLHASTDRYVNDGKIAQATAQMLARIGIDVSVEVETIATLVPKLRANKLDFFLLGAATGGAASAMSHLTRQIHSPGQSFGVGNFGAYVDPALDAIIERALNTTDDAAREELVRQVMRKSLEDVMVIPLHWQLVLVATKKGLKFQPRFDEQTLAMGAVPAK